MTEQDTKTIALRVPSWLVRKLDAAAKADLSDRSTFMRRTLAAAVASNEAASHQVAA